MKAGQRAVASVLLLDALAFLGFFVAALVAYTPNRVLPSLAVRWEFARAALDFFRWVPAPHFLAAAWATGSLAKGESGQTGQAILSATLLSLIVAAMGLIAAPGLEAERSSILASSARFSRALDAAKTSLDNRRLEEAREALTTLESIDRRDRRVEAFKDELLAAELKAGRSGAAASEAPRRPAPDPGAAKAAYLKALAFYEKRDYYSAHWHAALAERLDPGLLEARRLAAKAWEEILADRGGDPQDAVRAAFHARKLEGYRLLKAEDYLGAFQAFSSLAAEEPRDADVARYLKESLVGMEAAVFFKDEADKAAVRLAYPRFFLRLPAPPGQLRALAAREAAFEEGVAYFFELEYVEAGPGLPTRRVYSPYAKLLGDRLLLTAVERKHPEIVYRPAAEGGEAPSALEPGIDPITARRAAAGRIAPAALPLNEAWEALRTAERFGLDPVPIQTELLRRIGLIVALLGASVLGALLGQRFQAEELRGKLLPRMLPLALVAIAGWYFLDRADRTATVWAANFASGLPALGISLGLRLGLLILLALFAAGASTRARDAEPSPEDAG